MPRSVIEWRRFGDARPPLRTICVVLRADIKFGRPEVAEYDPTFRTFRSSYVFGGLPDDLWAPLDELESTLDG